MKLCLTIREKRVKKLHGENFVMCMLQQELLVIKLRSMRWVDHVASMSRLE
jgi:hypothetical protein